MSLATQPLFVELAGLPAAGKTTAAHLLNTQLLREGSHCAVVPEAAGRSPLQQIKRHWKFNAWNLCETVESILEHSTARDTDVVILDRGLVDTLCWIEWFRSKNEIDSTTARALESFAQVPGWFREERLVIVLRVTFETALKRRGAQGQIVNPVTFNELQESYNSVLGRLQEEGVPTRDIRTIDTDDLSPTQVLDRVVRFVSERRLQAASTSARHTTRR